MTEKLKIVVTGNPTDGFVYHGPFREFTDDIEASLEGDWWVAELDSIGEPPLKREPGAQLVTVGDLFAALSGAIARGIYLGTAVVVTADGWYDELTGIEDPTINYDYDCFTLERSGPMDSCTTPMHYRPEG